MSGRWRKNSESRKTSADEQQLKTHREKSALPVLLHMVSGPHGLPADEELQEMLRGKLRAAQANSAPLDSLFRELQARLVTVCSQDKLIYVAFQSFEEIWKFSTYYTTGLLSLCLERLLLDQSLWFCSLEDQVRLQVSVAEEKLQLLYRGVLMQEGSWFASCSSSQMFDSSTSGGDLYLQRGEIAQFEPPFLGSGWTVLRLADGARGTAPSPALEPVTPFHQWFLKSCSDSILVGDGKPACNFPLDFATGICVVMQDYDSEGPGELSVVSGQRIIIVGFLASCLDWFLGRKESTGEVGLVKTSLVQPSAEAQDSADVCLAGEEWMISTQEEEEEEEVVMETVAMLKRRYVNDTGQKYHLDVISDLDSKTKRSAETAMQLRDLKENIQTILEQRTEPPPDGAVTASRTTQQLGPPQSPSPPCFSVQPVTEGKASKEELSALFSFLGGRPYREELACLYSHTPQLLCSALFQGHSHHDQLMAFLSAARESARVKGLLWPQTRLCFLLGKLCAGRSKFSQARVYLEEALAIPVEAFSDLRLLSSIYSQLATVYLLQKKQRGFLGAAQRLAALLLAAPDCLDGVRDDSVLRYMLRRAVLSHSRGAETRVCLLLLRLHCRLDQEAQALPYLERLLVLHEGGCSLPPSRGYLSLGGFYSRLQCQHLAVGSARRASLLSSLSLADCLVCLRLAVDGADAHAGGGEPCAPPQLVPYIQRALSLTRLQSGGSGRRGALNLALTLSLCRLLRQRGTAGQAVGLVQQVVAVPACFSRLTAAERSSSLMRLAWILLEEQQPRSALLILDSILDRLPRHCTTPQEGVVLNMRGVALRCLGDLQGAAESYSSAADICQEYEDEANWAVAEANRGLLSLKAGADGAARRHLTEAVRLFSQLDGDERDESFITVLLELGQHYVSRRQVHYGKGCLEWALLLAIRGDLLDCQLGATALLSALYSRQSPDQVQSIVYSQHRLQLLRRSGDRGQEARALLDVSRLWLGLGTERAYQAALDCTKSSLGIFIDLGLRKKEASGWLQAGKIYHLLGHKELVDIYLQAAQDVALDTGDTGFILNFLEAAGDVFFDSGRELEKAVPYYKDRALPIAMTTGNVHARLRLCNKLTELLLNLKLHQDALEFAQIALDISTSLGRWLNQRVAAHRLATLLQQLQQQDLAEHYFLKSLSLCPTTLSFQEEALYYLRVYSNLGDMLLLQQEEPLDAAGYYQLALAAALDLGNMKSQLQLCTRLASIYHQQLLDRDLSLHFYQRARALAAELSRTRASRGLGRPAHCMDNDM